MFRKITIPREQRSSSQHQSPQINGNSNGTIIINNNNNNSDPFQNNNNNNNNKNNDIDSGGSGTSMRVPTRKLFLVPSQLTIAKRDLRLRLSYDEIALIISYLEFKDVLGIVTLVSRQWREVAGVHLTMKYFRARTASTPPVDAIPGWSDLKVTNRFIWCLASALQAANGSAFISTHVSDLPPIHLCFDKCYNVSDPFMSNLLSLSNIEKLHIPYAWRLSDNAFTRIGSSIKSLELRGCEGITDRTLAIIAKSATSLQHLGLSGIKNITDKGLQSLTTLTSLTSLDLSKCESITDKGLMALQRIPSLTSVNLSHNYTNITDEGVQCLRMMTNLQELRTEHCIKVKGVTRVVSSALLRSGGTLRKQNSAAGTGRSANT